MSLWTTHIRRQSYTDRRLGIQTSTYGRLGSGIGDFEHCQKPHTDWVREMAETQIARDEEQVKEEISKRIAGLFSLLRGNKATNKMYAQLTQSIPAKVDALIEEIKADVSRGEDETANKESKTDDATNPPIRLELPPGLTSGHLDDAPPKQ